MRTNYVLIDFENVMPEHLELLDKEWVRVLVFVGKSQSKLPIGMVKVIQKLGARAQYIEMSGSGHNALDFHIAFYIGRLAAVEGDAFFHIISNDQGFDPLVEHLKQEHIFADRVAKIEEIPVFVQTEAAAKPLAERVAFVEERILKDNATRPRTRRTLSSHIAALFAKTLSGEDVAAILAAMFADGSVRENGARLAYKGE